MHASQFLHNFFKKSLPEIHSTRLNSLFSATEDAFNCKSLTLTNLGRASIGPTQVKNKIKRIDRLLGNTNLHDELDDCYGAMIDLIISNKLHPIILVDWASVDNRNIFHVLKAAIAYEGRAITIYDQVEYKDRPREIYNSLDKFIDTLAKLLPPNCKPIIVADAAFSAKWFKRIEAKGWYWVGRLRGRVTMVELSTSEQKACKTMFQNATNVPTSLGTYVITNKNPIIGNLYIYKEAKKNRKRKNRNGSIKKNNSKYDHAESANEPWLLASNLPKRFDIEKKIVKIYKKRMQIEETFRDIKDGRYGFGIRETLSRCKKRVAVLLLIVALVLLILAILGKAAYEIGSYRMFQANTIKDRRVLSLWYLGRQVYEHVGIKEIRSMLKNYLSKVLEEIPTYELL